MLFNFDVHTYSTRLCHSWAPQDSSLSPWAQEGCRRSIHSSGCGELSSKPFAHNVPTDKSIECSDSSVTASCCNLIHGCKSALGSKTGSGRSISQTSTIIYQCDAIQQIQLRCLTFLHWCQPPQSHRLLSSSSFSQCCGCVVAKRSIRIWYMATCNAQNMGHLGHLHCIASQQLGFKISSDSKTCWKEK